MTSSSARALISWEGEHPEQLAVHRPEQRRQAEASRDAYQRVLVKAGFGPITTDIVDASEFYYAEDYHQQYLAKNPGGYCGLDGTSVACPTAVPTCNTSLHGTARRSNAYANKR